MPTHPEMGDVRSANGCTRRASTRFEWPSMAMERPIGIYIDVQVVEFTQEISKVGRFGAREAIRSRAARGAGSPNHGFFGVVDPSGGVGLACRKCCASQRAKRAAQTGDTQDPRHVCPRSPGATTVMSRDGIGLARRLARVARNEGLDPPYPGETLVLCLPMAQSWLSRSAMMSASGRAWSGVRDTNAPA